MKFRVFITIVALASFSTIQGTPFRELEFESVVEIEPAELNREKRTLTTICVEIKPSTPHEEPYFMCKGTDMPQFSKGGSYGGSGGSQSHYSSKPPYKPKPSVSYGESDYYQPGVKIDYNVPVKSDYHSEHSKYDKPPSYESKQDYSTPSKPSYDKKPSYFDHGSHASYSNYESKKPSYAKPYDAHGHHDDYSKSPIHKPSYSAAYEKPTSHYETAHGSKPQSYNYDNPSHVQLEPSAYSKGSSYEQKDSYDYKPSHNDGSYVKPSYGHSDSAYSAPHESKPNYSKPDSYSAKPSYGNEHSEKPSYGHSKPSYSEPSPSKPYTKPTYDSPASHSKPGYSSSEYNKPAKPYGVSEKEYSPAPGKPSPSQSYRAMSEDMLQQHWNMQPQVGQIDGFAYRSMDMPMGYYNFEGQRVMDQIQQQQYNPLDAPVKLDLSADQHFPPMVATAYPSSHYNSGQGAPAYSQDPAKYSDPAQSYSPSKPAYASVSSYERVAPTLQATYPSPYASPAPSYVPVSPAHNPATPSYGHELGIQSYIPPTQVYNPPCSQSYLYSMQPTIISLPCFSPQSGYGQQVHSQPLGSPITPTIGGLHQVYHSNINPLQDQMTPRSQGDSESGKPTYNNSTSVSSQESENKSDAENESSLPAKPETSNKSDLPEKSPEKTTQDQETGQEEPKDDQKAANAPATEGSDTKAVYQNLRRMAKIAAQLTKDDSNKADTGLPVSGIDKPAQFQS